MFDAEPYPETPQGELRYLTVVVWALRQLASGRYERSRITAALATDLEQRHALSGTASEPSEYELRRAGETCWLRIRRRGESLETDYDTEALKMMTTFNIGPDYASRPWLKEPFEFHPPIEPGEYPRELALHLEMLEQHTILFAINYALEPPDVPELGLC